MKHKLYFLFAGCLFCMPLHSIGQGEFSKGWIFPLEPGQGAVTSFDTSPDLFLATLAFSPQVTVIPGKLRIGLTGGGAFTNKRIYGIGGPRAALLLWKGPKVMESTVLNLQLVGEHLWGTKDQRLAGGGLAIEIGHMVTLSAKAHRDYRLNNWWFHGSLGLHLFRPHIAPPPDL